MNEINLNDDSSIRHLHTVAIKIIKFVFIQKFVAVVNTYSNGIKTCIDIQIK